MLSADQLPIIKGLADGLRPDPILSCSEWADEYRMLDSRGSPEPGKWRTSRVPYTREIMDNLSLTSPVVETVVEKGAQLAFTELGNNLVGYVIHHAPGPGLFLQPSQDIANRNVRQKIDPMVNSVPEIASLVPSKRSKDGGNTLEEKEFPGGIWLFKWASSTAGLRSSSIRYLILDEIDEYASEIGQQGDPEMLARARTNAYGVRKKIYIPSTPTVEGKSRIASLYEDSDQRIYKMPCPHCDAPIRFEMKNLRWDKGQPSTARYICQECDDPIIEWQKTKMLEDADRRNLAGEKQYGWVPQNPDNTHRRGYHISSLYSPVGFKSWAEIAYEFDDAQGNPAKLKSFVNTVLGETWKDKGEAPDWQRLYQRMEDYPRNVVPSGGLLLFAGVDIQKTWIEATVWAYGRNLERWVIDHRQWHCPEHTTTADDSHPDSPWHKLDALVSEVWPHESAGVCMPLTRLAVDSGYETQTVYRWSGRHSMAQVMPTKGNPMQSLMVGTATQVQVKANGKKAARGVKLWTIGLNVAKAELYSHLRADPPLPDEKFQTGFIHFPQLDEEFFKQLCGEEQKSRMVKGRMMHIWEAIRPRVEVLDTAICARAAAYLHGVDRFRDEHWSAIEKSLGITSESEPEKQQAPAKPARRPSNFWKGRR